MNMSGSFASVALFGCGLLAAYSGHSSDMTVTVISGTEIAPLEIQRAEKPVAHYLQDSNIVVFVSDPLYSGSCPRAEAKTDDDDGLVLVMDAAPTTRTGTRFSFKGSMKNLLVLPSSKKATASPLTSAPEPRVCAESDEDTHIYV